MAERDYVEEIKEEGRKEGRAAARVENLHLAIEAACDVLDIQITLERRAELDGLDAAGCAALRARLRTERRWD